MNFGEVILRDTLLRPTWDRVEKYFKKADDSWSDMAFMSAGVVSSTMLMVSALAVNTIGQGVPAVEYADLAIEAPVEENETANIRDALVQAWKELELEVESGEAGELEAQPAEAIGENDEVAAVEAEEKVIEAPVEPEITYPFDESVSVKVASGDTMDKILQRNKIGIDDTNAIIKAMKKHYNPRRLRVGQKFELSLMRESADKSILKKMEIKTGKLSHVEVFPEGEKFAAKKVEVATTRQIAKAGGIVTSSFYEAGDDAGIPRAITSELVKAYSYDVDFGRDIKPGQKLDVLFEQLVAKESGEVVGHGDLKYASFKLRGKKPIEIYKYTDRSGGTGYYKPNGESVRKALLKTPVNARISSKFGMRRHPILGYTKMHKGIDFAARTGTPIYAAGDGVVNFRGRKGGYGNYIRIKHNGTYQTAYAHLSRFAKGMRNGKRVKQGQVIGYVGSTGRSTGPHLHYEILKHGKQINPAGAKFRTGRVLKGKELAAFKAEKAKLKKQFASLPRLREQVAQAKSE